MATHTYTTPDPVPPPPVVHTLTLTEAEAYQLWYLGYMKEGGGVSRGPDVTSETTLKQGGRAAKA